MPKPDTLIFDIGNVLVRFDYNLAVKRLAGVCGGTIPDPEALELAKKDYEGGRIDRLTFLNTIRNLLDYTGSDADLTAMWENIFTLNEPMESLVAALAARYPLYLLSNTSDLHMSYVRRTYDVFRHFRDGVYSHEARMLKPDPEIFRHTIEKFGVDPASTIYIDDLEPNVAAAAGEGLVALLYDPDAHSTLEQQLRSLRVEW